MPSATKATFSLDPASLARLETLAHKWQVPKTEALRRALQQAADNEKALSAQEKIALLHRLQTKFAEAGVDFERWKRDIKLGRR